MTAPNYDFHVFCCINRRDDGAKRGCCASKGAEDLQKYMKVRAKELGIANIRVNKSGCLDQCEEGPVLVVYPQGTWYHYETREDIDRILEQHLKGGQPVTKLELR